MYHSEIYDSDYSTNEIIRYEIDTMPGQSGSPTFNLKSLGFIKGLIRVISLILLLK